MEGIDWIFNQFIDLIASVWRADLDSSSTRREIIIWNIHEMRGQDTMRCFVFSSIIHERLVASLSERNSDSTEKAQKGRRVSCSNFANRFHAFLIRLSFSFCFMLSATTISHNLHDAQVTIWYITRPFLDFFLQNPR